MAPHRNAHRSNASPFEQLDRIKNFAKQIQMFKVYGDERHEVRLRNGDVVVGGECVEIKQGKDYSGTSYHGERWYAEVVEIKGENEDSGDMELYLLCNWFYSRTNLRNYTCTVQNLTRCPLSRGELALSTHQQVIPVDFVLRKVSIRSFNELDRYQPAIGVDELWYRFTLRVGNKAMDNRLVLGNHRGLPPGRCAVEKCTKRYNPDEDFQRLCPRPGCGLWFHNKCLENVRFERTSRWTLRHRLEAMLTGTKELISDMGGNDWELGNAVPAECYKWFSEEVKKEVKGVPGCQFPTYEIGSISNVVWCAQTPISRGCRYGVVGNEEAVAKARMILKEIWNGGRKNGRPEDRQVEWFKNCNPPTQRLFSCMRCGLAI